MKKINFIKLKRNKKTPLFSIITVVKNGEEHIERCIKSVLKQKISNFEYIIIDGKSNDNTLKIVKKYIKNIDILVSEKDKGIYDAFNKGISLSSGQFIGIVNSDDILTSNALMIIKKYIKKMKFDFIFGSVKKHWGILYGYKPEKIWYSWGFYSSHSTGFYIKNDSAKKVGKYNLKYKYHADYDYFYRMIVKKKMKGISTKKNEVTGVFSRGGYSSKIPYQKLFYEEIKIRFDNGQNLFFLLILSTLKIIKNIRKFIFKQF